MSPVSTTTTKPPNCDRISSTDIKSLKPKWCRFNSWTLVILRGKTDPCCQLNFKPEHVPGKLNVSKRSWPSKYLKFPK